MPYYKWKGVDDFSDNRNGRVIEPGDTVELSENVAGPQPEFVEVEAPNDGDDSGGSDGEDGAVALEDKDYSELRDMAVDADTDEINGRSSKDDIVAYFESE